MRLSKTVPPVQRIDMRTTLDFSAWLNREPRGPVNQPYTLTSPTLLTRTAYINRGVHTPQHRIGLHMPSLFRIYALLYCVHPRDIPCWYPGIRSRLL